VFLCETWRSLRLCVIFALLMRDKELSHAIIGAAIEIHRSLGPGLLEAVYEECLAREFTLRVIPFERQKPIPLVYKDLKLECGYRLDFLVMNRIVVEIKSIESIAPIHESVMLTYLRLSGSSLGLLINFNVPILKDGIKRYVWHYQEKDNAESLSDAEARREERNELQTGLRATQNAKIII
jgi:GxxExxY protein